MDPMRMVAFGDYQGPNDLTIANPFNPLQKTSITTKNGVCLDVPLEVRIQDQ